MSALLAADAGRYLEAGRLIGAAADERKRLGYVRFVVDERDVDPVMAKIEAALGPSGLAVALSEGAGLSVHEAVGYARRGRGRRGRPSFGWASCSRRREVSSSSSSAV
jgi:hypothetical protein